MTPAREQLAELAVLIEEAKRRGIKLPSQLSALDKPDVDVLAHAFPRQIEFINDPSRLKAALCTRRAGKSVAILLYMLHLCLSKPDTHCVYAGLNRKSVKRSVWREAKRLLRDLKLEDVKLNETDLTVTFANHSSVTFIGLDSSMDQQETVRGSYYALVVVDEAGSFRTNLRDMVESALRPLTWDVKGTVCLLGTPRNVKNFFHGVTTGEDEAAVEWSVHRWSWADNPHVADNVREEIESIIAKRPRFTETPQYKQEYLGEWAIDDSKLVYRFNAERNSIDELPEDAEYRYLISIDFGFVDATAWVVVAWSRHDDTLYVVEVVKERELLPDEIVATTRKLRERYTRDGLPPMIVGDTGGQGKPVVEHIKDKLRIPVQPAIKTGLKLDSQMILNGDLIQGRVKVLPGCSALVDEWDTLTWDERELEKGKRVENEACDNHAADAMLYAWRSARNHHARPRPDAPPARGTKEWEDAEFDRHLERVQRGQDGDRLWTEDEGW